MKLSRHEQGQLFIAAAAAIHAAIVNKGKSKPMFAARIAKEHALAAVEVNRTNSKRTGK